MSKKINNVKRVYGIYAIINTINGKMIIGNAQDINKRWSNYKTMLANGEYGNKYLQEDVDIYGVDNFEFKVLEYCQRKADLSKQEKYWMDYYNTRNREFGYNINDIKKLKKKVRRGKEAKNFKAKRSEITKGINNGHCNTEEDIVIRIKAMIEMGMRNKDIVEIVGVSQNKVTKIRNKIRWPHIDINDYIVTGVDGIEFYNVVGF